MAESYYNSSLTAEEIEATLLGSVRGDATQNKTAAWKTKARQNIGAAGADDVVSIAKGGTDADNAADARTNLGLGTAAVVDIDDTLSVSGAAAEAATVGKLRDALYGDSAVDVLRFRNGTSRTYAGVTYTFNSDGSCTISGTATATSFVNIISSSGALPESIVPGRRYYLDTHGASGNVKLRVTYYRDGASAGYVMYGANKQIRFLDDITGILIRYEVSEGVTVIETVHYTLTAVPESSPSLAIDSDIEMIEGAISASRFFGFWEQGTLNVQNGKRNEATASEASTTRIRTGVFVGYENNQLGANALDGYTFTVWKYSAADKSFIGTLRDDGSFRTGSGATRVTSYSFEPGFLYRLVLFAPDTTAQIKPIAGATYVSFTVGSWASKFRDVKIAFLGDSIIAGRLGDVAAGVGTKPSYTIPQRVEQELGVFTFNFAVDGMGWIGDTSGASRGNAYGLIQTLDLSDYTHVVLSFGANDGAFPIGAIDDTAPTESTATSSGGTILGNVYGVLDYIHTTWPAIQVILVSPIMNKHGSFPTWGWTVLTAAGWTWAQLTEKMDEFAERYHLQIIHGDRALNSWLVGDYIGSDTDNVHPVEQGYNLIGRYVAGQMSALL